MKRQIIQTQRKMNTIDPTGAGVKASSISHRLRTAATFALIFTCSSLKPTSCPHLPTMVDLFVDRVLVKNNRERDELDTEPELMGRLQNRILLLFFGSSACHSCRAFAPTLAHFFRQLTDESYVERSAQLVLLYVR